LQLSAGRNGFYHFYITCFQKLGCFSTGGSALTKVIPIGFTHHILL
jgi:hypothetical protein